MPKPRYERRQKENRVFGGYKTPSVVTRKRENEVGKGEKLGGKGNLCHRFKRWILNQGSYV